MDCEIEESNSGLIIKVKENIVAENCSDLRNIVVDQIKKNNINFILDLKETNFIDSAGLGVIIGLRSTINSKKGSLQLTNLNKRILEIFKITRIDKIFGLEEH